MKNRCSWSSSDPIYITYHDTEWGVPLHEEHKWFEFIVLDGAQAGLSWLTVLRKREHYRKVFDNFHPATVALYDADKIQELLLDPGIIRNKLKVNSAVKNAQAFLRIQKKFGSFDNYIWQFVDGKPIVNSWETLDQIPAKTRESDAMSKDLIKRGFTFVGSTICYAFMQAAGMVNDHLVDCFRYNQVQIKG